MTRLPVTGSDDGSWGNILNDFLAVEHNADGTLKASGSLAAKADDSGVVHSTGNESIGGTKTFVSAPIVPTPSSGTQAANKSYVDGVAGSGSTPDAGATTKGKIQLAGDLGGTAAAPTVPGLAGKVGSVTAADGTVIVGGTVTAPAIQVGTITESQVTNLTTDLAAKAADSTVVHLAGTETITGAKVFNAGTLLDKGNSHRNVRAYGALGDDATDDTTAIQAALNACIPGEVVFLPQGRYRTSLPLIIPPGVTIRGTHARHLENAGYVDTATYIKPLSGFSGAACLYMVDKEIGGYASDNCEQRINNLTLDGSALSGNTIDGIKALGKVHGVIIEDVCIKNFPNHGIFTTSYTRADTSSVNPYSWRIRRVIAVSCGSYAFTFSSLTDSTIIDVETIGAGKSGFYLNNCSNTNFIGCRAEWSAQHGFEIHTGSFGHCQFTSTTTDRNTMNGVYITTDGGAGGTGVPVLFTGLTLHRDGRNSGGGGGGYAGFRVNAATAPIIVDGVTVAPGVDDDGSQTNSPQYGVSVNGSSYVSINSGFLHANTAGWNDGGSNTVLRRGPNVGEQTGLWNSPTNVLQNNWGTDNGSTFAANINVANTNAIAINSATVANTTAPLLGYVTSTSTDRLISSRATADTQNRFNLQSSGLLEWGSGTIARDTNLYRSAADTLKTDDSFIGLAVGSSGLTGATAASRYVGATASGAPASGTFAVGDFIVDQTGKFYICTAAGSPGTWTLASGTNGQPMGLPGTTAATRYVGGTSGAAPASGTFAIGDFVVDTTNGGLYVCTAGGTPGTWQSIGRLTNSTTPVAPGTAAVGTAITAARADHVHPPSAVPVPADQNLIAWSADPSVIRDSAVIVAGTVVLIRVTLRQAATITNLIAHVGTAGSGLTAGQNFAALFDSSGNQVGITADQTTNWSSAMTRTMALISPYSATAGTYFVALLSNGTTPPQFARGSGIGATLYNIGTTTSAMRFATNATGQTGMPASLTLSNNVQATSSWWAAVS